MIFVRYRYIWINQTLANRNLCNPDKNLRTILKARVRSTFIARVIYVAPDVCGKIYLYSQPNLHT